MKTTKILVLILALIVSLTLTACGKAETVEESTAPPTSSEAKTSAPARSENESQSPSIAEQSEIEQSQSDDSSVFPDLLPQGSYIPTELFDWQEDPTNETQPHFSSWDHVEYRAFGKPDEFVEYEKVITEVSLNGSFMGNSEELIIQYCLPQHCYDESVFYFDAGFANGPIKFGELPSHYARVPADKDAYHLDQGIFRREELTQFLNNQHNEILTQDNIPGGIYETEQFIRGIALRYDTTHLITYYVKLDNDKIMYLYFFVSSQANTQDLSLYDAIVASIQVKDS